MTYFPKEGKQYLAQLKEYSRRLGHVPSFKEANDAPELPPANNYAYYFGSYSDAAEIVERQLEREKAKSEPDEEEVVFCEPKVIHDYDDSDDVDDQPDKSP